eukprot:CAMPEP_0174959432 /NCGR_PEP_ID=MMETSP0004_2-20121128/3172_1 /TAXON_ID=420556 /ORGANISM="Ochromonas sp., Strain CCMP1393" /LENGTH=312 /DNA_ID=CAMNT_0016207747 /DNA_START=258 /DNA_END=1196 /DNA_ORIENTATION=+
MATFNFLTPQTISVQSVNCLGRCNKGPNTRILTPDGAFVEASMVRSVEKVVELLQNHLALDINITSADVLRLNYEGNVHLRSGEVDKAIQCYDRALELGDKEQEGVLLVMRGTALLQRSYACRMRHRDVINVAEEVLPTMESITSFLTSMLSMPPILRCKLTMNLLVKVAEVYEGKAQQQDGNAAAWDEIVTKIPGVVAGATIASGEELLTKARFTWSLYENSLMRALQDLLTSTLVLPSFAQAWRRAGDALSEVRRFSSAVEYYEVAIRLDAGLTDVLMPTIERLKVLERLLENAEMKGWPVEAILSLIDE